jgi:hypothetical protein
MPPFGSTIEPYRLGMTLDMVAIGWLKNHLMRGCK